MNPIKLSQQLQDTLVSYLTTTFDVNRDGQEPALAEFLKQSFTEQHALFAGPYLELTPPYKTAETLQQLAAEGVISPKLLELPCFKQQKPLPVDRPLYTHQAAALRKLCVENRNIVVSSGTGSGKTECFLIPILNDLLIDDSPGVRAVLVYPLNALVNDQLDRLRILLRGTGISFGRYTSELEERAETARKQMAQEWHKDKKLQELFSEYPLPEEIVGRDEIQVQKKLPKILITNYAMLEYLLLRPEDNPLFDQVKWRFVVLDEAHTYAGAQGIEVGLLMRRLKLRLGHQPGEMRCIATSATLTNDDATDASKFAQALFGEEFAKDDIIFGQPNHEYVLPTLPKRPPVTAYISERFDDLIYNVRQEKWESPDEMALLMQEIGLIDDEQLDLADQTDSPRFLWEVLRDNEDLAQLRKLMAEKGAPVEVATVAKELFCDRLPAEQHQIALYHLIELAAMARPEPESPSLLPARYHLFVRPPQGIWACLNPICPDKQSGNQWSKLFAAPRKTCDACQEPVYPLVVCRSCGQVYVRLQKVGKQYLPEAAMFDKPTNYYVTWRLINENRGLAEEDEDDENTLVEQAGESVLIQSVLTLCLKCQEEVRPTGKCGCADKSKYLVKLFLLAEAKPVKKGKDSGVEPKPVHEMNECGRCHGRAIRGTEIATELSLNALTPLAILTEDLYRSLPESERIDVKNKAGGGRKLISFYDSRQGAARFAAFIQDVVNQQAYRRIIKEAVAITSTVTDWPDLEEVSETCLTLALESRVLHNDPRIDKDDLPNDLRRLNSSPRMRLLRYMRTQILAEVTTQLRSRQSLEALGLVGVQYFEPDHIPDLIALARQIQLTELETQTLIEYLLDDLRRGKVVKLNDIRPDDPIFGRNKFSPRVVRGQDANEYELAWIGKTARHRRRQLVSKVLRYKGLPDDDTSIIQALKSIFDWLIDHSALFDTSQPTIGYQLRQDRLFFQAHAQWYRCKQCQRLSCRGNALPCPYPHCSGTLHPLEIGTITQKNFFHDNMDRKFVPMRIEEHTAQLAPAKGRDYQNQFKSGSINMLSCSTTFEMGIDLGDLQAVVMSNIPPTVANYKQRAGRAGRRASGTAFILAWAADRPHDQSYFKDPAEIIGGRVRVPFLDVQNQIIIQRHVNAILLSEFLLYCTKLNKCNGNIGAFFEEQTVGGSYYKLLPDWLKEQQTHLLEMLSFYAVTVNQAIDPPHTLMAFERELQEKAYGHYHDVINYYKVVRQEKSDEQRRLMDAGSSRKEISLISTEIDRYSSLYDRLRHESIINYLSDRGVLPSYSFPLHVVELRIPPHLQTDNQLRLQRNIQQAIREYAPGQEVVADKRIWKSEALDFFGKEPQIFSYHICPTCNYLRVEKTAGKALEQMDQPCPVCYAQPKRGKWQQYQYIQPDGFRASNDSGQPAGQYVERPFNLMRSALVPRPVEARSYGQALSIGYDRAGELLYVNEGVYGSGFRICPKCGKEVGRRSNKCDGTLNGQPCPGRIDMNAAFMLGFKQETDTLHLKFTSTSHILLPAPDNLSFWVSLKYALLHGASHALQIERKDIDGVLFPEAAESLGQQWRQSIVLYDNVPGGAGHVKQIRDNIAQVIASALKIVTCNCEKSCYRCLREYANQWEHHLLDRKDVAVVLRALVADLEQNSATWSPVPAVNPTAWLWEHLQRVQQELIICADQITLQSPTAEGLTWLDLLQQLLQCGVKVTLYLNHLPDQREGSSEAITQATHLRLLLPKGLQLRQSNQQIPWVAIIDPGAITPSAIKATDEKYIILGNDVATQLSTTHQPKEIAEIWQALKQYPYRVVGNAELREPANTHVTEVKSDKKRHSEAEYFADFYAAPVRSMIISDRYLYTKDKILNRLGAHIDLAQQNKVLKEVIVKTERRDDEQRQAIRQLENLFPHLKITFRFDPHIVHDRYIEITRIDGSKARVIIGVGLDFIEPTGHVRDTFIVFQYSYTK